MWLITEKWNACKFYPFIQRVTEKPTVYINMKEIWFKNKMYNRIYLSSIMFHLVGVWLFIDNTYIPGIKPFTFLV